MPCLWRFVRGVVSMGVVCGVKGTVSGGVSGGVSSSMSSLSSLRSEVYVVIGSYYLHDERYKRDYRRNMENGVVS